MISVHYYNSRLYFIIYSIKLSFYFYYCYLILGWRVDVRTTRPAKAEPSGGALPSGSKSKEAKAQFATTLHLSDQGPGVLSPGGKSMTVATDTTLATTGCRGQYLVRRGFRRMTVLSDPTQRSAPSPSSAQPTGSALPPPLPCLI